MQQPLIHSVAIAAAEYRNLRIEVPSETHKSVFVLIDGHQMICPTQKMSEQVA